MSRLVTRTHEGHRSGSGSFGGGASPPSQWFELYKTEAGRRRKYFVDKFGTTAWVLPPDAEVRCSEICDQISANCGRYLDCLCGLWSLLTRNISAHHSAITMGTTMVGSPRVVLPQHGNGCGIVGHSGIRGGSQSGIIHRISGISSFYFLWNI